ncbi:MAG: glycosyltransferase family 2 protein [Candidatus Aminicenantales bacterium]
MVCDLSIIIVNWNTKSLLKQCLESIKAHTKKISYEIIVVDNSSTDGSADMVEANFPEVILIKNEKNLGYGQANNQALVRAQGKYVLFLNSDVAVNDNCLDEMFEFMENHPQVGASACKLTYPDGRLQHSCRQFPSFKVFFLMLIGLRAVFPKMKIFQKYMMLDWDHSDLREVDQIMGSFMFVRKDSLEQIGSFDQRYWMYFEEVDLCLRLNKAGWKIVHYPYASAVHYLSKSSEQWSEAKRVKEFQRSLLKYFRKNGKFYEYYILFILNTGRLLGMPFLKFKSKKTKAKAQNL